MALFDPLKSLFRPAVTPPEPESWVPVPERTATPPAPSGPEQPSVAATPVEFTSDYQPLPDEALPDWLEDVNLLRDEGVLYGLSESPPDEKTLIIRTYFQRQTAPLEQEIEQHNERIGELNLFIGEKEDRIHSLRTKLAQLEAQRPEGEHQLPRTLIGLAFSVVMCVGNYYLIEETLRPAFQDSRPISIGLFLAGMFSLFNRTSVFHEAGARMTFRRLLEEMGLPFAASLFLLVQAWQTQSAGKAIALSIFIFFLFLFAGKLLLGTLTVLRNDLRFWSQGRKLESEKKHRSEAWEGEIQQLTTEIDQLRVQKWQVIPVLNRAEAERNRANARRDMLIHQFESEYNLARSLRNRLTEAQRRIIRGD
ncbi:hypothetical protein [Tellurirhabdus bombi]|uniref:hypothetical protein n=1 Tax=Tellurirhabdus bombi TaxID=2907205 RepID=UPI001F207197|nr:hypothetical protein [Tellurirhabdus bombi]